MEVVFGIYCWFCRQTGKRYIGSSVDTLKREQAHRNLLRRGAHHSSKLQNAWNKYGEDAFEFDLLDPWVCLSDLRRVEETLIHTYDTYKNGYNETTLTGPATSIPPEVKAKMSVGAKLAGADPELRRSRSERAKAQHAAGNLGQATWKPGTAKTIGLKNSGKKRPSISKQLRGNQHARKRKHRLS